MSGEPLYLPFYRVNLAAPFFIFTHGLGSKNPQEKCHKNDNWVSVAAEAAKLSNSSFLTYTARGHGESKGWQDTAATDSSQFTWRRLADDMNWISNTQGVDKFVAGGSSMGSATALYCAIQYPEKVLGLVLVRLPTAWETRLARKRFILNSASRFHAAHPEGLFHHVLEGAAEADLPPRDSSGTYDKISCPVLILTIEGDEVHPVSTAEAVHALIPQSTLVIAKTEEEAAADWPFKIASFVSDLGSTKVSTSGYERLP
jgi:pimeloyl-ACP methyl ester carboxylesterase